MDTLGRWLATWPPLAVDALRYFNGLLLLAAIFIPLERACAQTPKAVLREGWRTDVAYYFLTSLLPARLLTIPVAALVWALHGFAPQGMWPALAELPSWARFSLALVIAEVGFYWGHRWMHASGVLWRFHAIHHSADEMDWLVNTRAHPVDLVVVRLCGLLPLYALGLVKMGHAQVDWIPLLVTLVGSLWGYFIHANLRWRLGWLEQVIATPAFHHWHHDRLAGSPRLHGNYAAFLPVMDRIFGTWRLPEDEWPKRYGTDDPMPHALVDQLMAPLMGPVRQVER